MAMKVPGSEKFANEPKPIRDILETLPDDLRLHYVTDEEIESVDPLTYEVIRHRICAITNSMGDTLKRMSGSIIVSEVNDCNVSIMDAGGDVVQVGLWNMLQAGAIDMAVKWILEHRSHNPGIAEGDMYIMTDPWVGGGLHQNDAVLVAPLFHEGILFAWVGAIAHQVDLGGVAPGSWTTKAMDVFWESLPMPPMRIVEGGRVREDIEDAYIRRSRIPSLIALDFRAKIGANNVGIEGLQALIRKYGATTVKAVMMRMLNDSEQRLSNKLSALPDGVWKAATYQDSARETDRGIYKIALTMTKTGDRLTFDFRGTDPQVDGLINCTYGGMRAGVVGAILPLLCGDIPWAPGGLLRLVTIISDKGTINNCDFPHAVGKGSVASSWSTQNVAIECLSGLLDTNIDPVNRETVMGVSCGTWDCAVLSGLDQYEHPFVYMVGDSMAGGMGARGNMDGVDTAGIIGCPMGSMPDVEMVEFLIPVLYLWRREVADSGGPGKNRGGVSGCSCFIAHDTPLDSIHLVVSHNGRAIPQAVGISGGYPANSAYDILISGSNATDMLAKGHIPDSLEEITGEPIEQPPHNETELYKQDVYYMEFQSGGGYGDPLLRAPALVEQDVLNGRVTAETARTIYGVVMEEEALDRDKTEQQREQLRRERAGGSTPTRRVTDTVLEPGDRRLNENLVIRLDNMIRCAHCEVVLGDTNQPLKNAILREGAPSLAGSHIKSHYQLHVDRPVIFRQLLCPACFTSLSAEISPSDEPSPRDKFVTLLQT